MTKLKNSRLLNIYFIFYFWLYWVFADAQGLSLVAESGGYCLVTGHRLLTVAASLVVEHDFRHTSFSGCGLQALERGLNSCGAQAQLLHGTWNLPVPGIKPVSPALAGGFLSTAPPGKSKNSRILHTWLVRPSRYLPKFDAVCSKMVSN